MKTNESKTSLVRKLFPLILAEILLLCCLPLLASAMERSSGGCGENVTWALSDEGVLTISGSGEMEDYDYSASVQKKAPWYARGKEITSVVINEGVTKIGNQAFSGCSNLNSIQVSESNPSYVCKDGVLFDKGLTTLLCYPVGKPETQYVIPDGVTSIKGSAFYGCTGLTSITLPGSVTSIDPGAFFGCANLKNVIIPDGVTRIESDTFSGCTSLTSITIPASVTSIEVGTFKGNTFDGCTHLESIQVAEDNLNYASKDGVLFNKGFTRLLRYPEGKPETQYTVPDSVTRIEWWAFRDCSNLTEVTFGNGVTFIGERAFYGCTGLTSVTISASVVDIAGWAFEGCSSLQSFQVSENNSCYASKDGVLFNKDFTHLVRYPEGKPETQYAIPDGVTRIRFCAFDGCTGLTNVTIPGSVTSIENFAFYGCTGLTNVTIPGSVTYIGQSVFNDCTGLKSITIPDGVTSIEWGAFRGCTGLTNVTIPASVTSIGNAVFFDCTSLTSITIPNSVTEIGGEVFYGCTGLTNVTIPASVTSIGSGAFNDCTGLKSIQVSEDNLNYASKDGVLFDKELTTLLCCPAGKSGAYAIPASVTSIGDGAFFGCTGLTGITIPDGVTSIGGSAFSNCTGLTTVAIPDGVTEIEDWTFDGCTSLTSIAIPDSVTSIGDGAFFDCVGLTSITISDSVAKIGDSVFEGCTSLTSITIPGGVTSMERYAFYGCASLKSAIFEGNAPTVGRYVFCATADDFCIYYPDSGATGWTTPTWTSSSGDIYSCKPISELPPDNPTPPVVTPPIGDDTPNEPENPAEPVVETETAPDGTVTTTTTWTDGKKAVQEKTPDGGAKVEVTAPTGETIAKIDLPADPGAGKGFEDVKEGAWYESAVDKATAYGLFDGSTETTFAPNGNMTRGMVAQVLYNLSGKTGYGAGSGNFTDVAAGKWYENAIDWAAKAEIVSGTGEGKFAPEQSVTREQLVSMLYRYAQAIGADTKASMGLGSFPDGNSVSDYAKTAMQWAVAEGFISGRNQNGGKHIAPNGTATRAEVAAILTRFVEFLK